MNTRKNRTHLYVYKPSEPRYPNAADDRYFAQKALDVATAILSGIGFTTAMVFLFTMA